MYSPPFFPNNYPPFFPIYMLRSYILIHLIIIGGTLLVHLFPLFNEAVHLSPETYSNVAPRNSVLGCNLFYLFKCVVIHRLV